MARTHSKKLTRAENYLVDMLKAKEQSIVTHYEFFRLIQIMYREGKELYLKHDTPTEKDHRRFLRNLHRAGVIKYDEDYGSRLIRILVVSEQSTEEVVCFADPLCYVSHLSSMHRWGLTDRSSYALICTRPDRKTSTVQLTNMMSTHLESLPPRRVRLKYIGHPQTVRNRSLRIFESKAAGDSIKLRGTGIRLATIGQTFLDMLQQPELCGGIAHALDIYHEHAPTWLDEIITSVDSSNSKLVKSRAGYILEERLGFHHKKIETWKDLGQRGGSRKLDPTKAFAPVYSETWMLSLNV